MLIIAYRWNCGCIFSRVCDRIRLGLAKLPELHQEEPLIKPEFFERQRFDTQPISHHDMGAAPQVCICLSYKCYGYRGPYKFIYGPVKHWCVISFTLCFCLSMMYWHDFTLALKLIDLKTLQ